MPTYVYRCAEEHEFEADQGINEDPIEECIVFVPTDDPPQAMSRMCGAACKRVIQRTFFKIGGAGVYKPGFQ
jgi:predicted nucleic acid-binding Zn ribbon protein